MPDIAFKISEDERITLAGVQKYWRLEDAKICFLRQEWDQVEELEFASTEEREAVFKLIDNAFDVINIVGAVYSR